MRRNNLKRFLALTIAATQLFGTQAFAAVRNDTHWKNEADSWYLLDGANQKLKGWQEIASGWYYMNPTDAKMQTGIINIDGKSYFMNDMGALTGARTDTHWAQEGAAWYLLDSNNKKLTGWQEIPSGWYYMDPTDAKMQTGWKKINNIWYYFNAYGTMATGWQNINNEWYYMDASGSMRSNCVIDGWKLDGSGRGSKNSVNKVTNKISFGGGGGSSSFGGGGGSSSFGGGGSSSSSGGNHKYSSEVRDIAEDIVDEITNSNMSDFEKEMAILSWFTDNVRYDYTYKKYNAIDALEDGSAVCQGYAEAFEALGNAAGLKVKTVRGDEADNHAWNLINLDGSWYHVDPCWSTANCEQGNGATDYSTINLSDKEIKKVSNHRHPQTSIKAKGGKYGLKYFINEDWKYRKSLQDKFYSTGDIKYMGYMKSADYESDETVKLIKTNGKYRSSINDFDLGLKEMEKNNKYYKEIVKCDKEHEKKLEEAKKTYYEALKVLSQYSISESIKELISECDENMSAYKVIDIDYDNIKSSKKAQSYINIYRHIKDSEKRNVIFDAIDNMLAINDIVDPFHNYKDECDEYIGNAYVFTDECIDERIDKLTQLVDELEEIENKEETEESVEEKEDIKESVEEKEEIEESVEEKEEIKESVEEKEETEESVEDKEENLEDKEEMEENETEEFESFIEDNIELDGGIEYIDDIEAENYILGD